MAIQLRGILRSFMARPANFDALSPAEQAEINANWQQINARFPELQPHPDFERFRGREARRTQVIPGVTAQSTQVVGGIVEPTLGPDGKPVYAAVRPTPPAPQEDPTTGPDQFKRWYNDDPRFNFRVPCTLTLEDSGNGIFTFDSDDFFPLDTAELARKVQDGSITAQEQADLAFLFEHQFLGNALRQFTNRHKYHFTFEVTGHTFTYQGTEVFTFDGDDDLWVFIDGKLAIDLGGSHRRERGTVDLRLPAGSDRLVKDLGNGQTLELIRGQDYSFDLFHAERHTKGSHFRIDTSLQVIPPPLPVASLTTADPEAKETRPGDEPNIGEFRLQLDKAPTAETGPITVQFSLEDTSTATEQQDFAPLGRSVTFQIGERTTFVPVIPLLDNVQEGRETVNVRLISSDAYIIDPIDHSGQVTIIDLPPLPPPPTVNIVATVPQAQEPGLARAGRDGEFTVSIGGSDPTPRSDLLVDIVFSGTAQLGDDGDYQLLPPSVPATGQLKIPANHRQVVITVVPKQDRLDEGQETVVATLQPKDTYRLGQAEDVVTITDTPLPVVTIRASRPQAREPGPGVPRLVGEFTIELPERDRPRSGDLVVTYEVDTTAPNSAAPDDYDPRPFAARQVIIPQGRRSATIPVIPTGDRQREGPEVVTLSLTPQEAYRVGQRNRASVTITDTPLPTVSIDATKPRAIEPGRRARQNGEFTIAIGPQDSPSPIDLPVSYRIDRSAANSATPGLDYFPLRGTPPGGGDRHTVVIPKGQRHITIPVVPKGDRQVEGNELVTLQLLPRPDRYFLGQRRDTVVITDVIPPPIAAIQATQPHAREPGRGQPRRRGEFTITLDQPVPRPTVIKYHISGSATLGQDYVRLRGNAAGLTGQVAIPANQRHLKIPVIPLPDRANEPRETVVVQLAPGASYQLDPDPEDIRATVFISDAPPTLVSIRASDPDAREPKQGNRALPAEQGEFEIRLHPPATRPITVHYGISGSATPGRQPRSAADYELKQGRHDAGQRPGGNSLVIPAGQNSAKLTVVPFKDFDATTADRRESVVAALARNGDSYELHPNPKLRRATVIIRADGDGDPTGSNGKDD